MQPQDKFYGDAVKQWFSPWKLECFLKAQFAGLFTGLQGSLFDFFVTYRLINAPVKSHAILIFYSWGMVASGSGSIIGSKVIFCLWLQATKTWNIGVAEQSNDGCSSATKGIANGTLNKGRVCRTTWSQFKKKKKPKPKSYHYWKEVCSAFEACIGKKSCENSDPICMDMRTYLSYHFFVSLRSGT